MCNLVNMRDNYNAQIVNVGIIYNNIFRHQQRCNKICMDIKCVARHLCVSMPSMIDVGARTIRIHCPTAWIVPNSAGGGPAVI